jgi:hypothetical protein
MDKPIRLGRRVVVSGIAFWCPWAGVPLQRLRYVLQHDCQLAHRGEGHHLPGRDLLLVQGS